MAGVRRRRLSADAAMRNVSKMLSSRDSNVVAEAEALGLAVTNRSWVDTGRDKGSSGGTNIMDITLAVGGRLMPAIRHPNFSDLTCDLPMEDIMLPVGNEDAEERCEPRLVSLTEYLRNIDVFLSRRRLSGQGENLLGGGRDEKVLFSAQACILPSVKGAAATEFEVQLYDYRYGIHEPRVLVIVSCAGGTSAQLIDRGNLYHGQAVGFNSAGYKAPFNVERASEFRERCEEQGVQSAAIERQAASQNRLTIIQVPLEFIKKPPIRRRVRTRGTASRVCDIEAGVIHVGDRSEERFEEFGSYRVKRDKNLPVRVLYQHYYCASEAGVTSELMQSIAAQLTSYLDQAKPEDIGSLVVNPLGGRLTEPTAKEREDPTSVPPATKRPAWWNTFWLTWGRTFERWTNDEAWEVVKINCSDQELTVYSVGGECARRQLQRITNDFCSQ